MLYAIDSEMYIDVIPHKSDYDEWRTHISDEDYKKIVDTLEEKVISSDINTAGWIPGHDWTGTVYEPIYYACGRSQTKAGQFFGLILFELLMNLPDTVWGFGRYEKNGVDIGSMTYFKLDNPPKKKKKGNNKK